MTRWTAHIYIFLLSICWINNISAQQDIDSLRKVIKNSKDEETLADTYNDLAYQFAYSKPDSAIFYGNMALDLSEKHNLQEQIAPAYNAIGLAYQSKGMYQISIDHLTKQLPYLKSDSSALSRTYHNIGLSYKFLGNLNTALEYEIKSAKAIEKSSDPVALGAIYLSIGNIYRDLQDYDLAYSYLQKSLKTYESGTNFGISSKNSLIAMTYSGIGSLFLVKYEIDSAIYYHSKAIDLLEKEPVSYNLAILIENLGDDYLVIDEREKAIKQFQRAKQIMEALQSGADVGYEYYKIANVYRIAKQYNKALSYNDSALVLFTKYDAVNFKLASYDLNFRIYDSMGRPAEALENYKLYIALKDSLNSESQQSEVLRLKEEFETTQKEQRIELLETSNALQLRENERQVMFRNIAIGLIIMLLGFGLLIWNRYRIKQQVKQLQMRNDIAIDLHDEVGSSLSSIKMLSEIAALQKDDKHQLDDLLGRIQVNASETAEKMHDIIWMINPKHDQLSGILSRMENFMFDMCSPGEISFNLQKNIDPNIKLNMLQRKDLMLIFKEAVNNAVKYAAATNIQAHISYVDHHVQLIVTDNGKGFDLQTIRRGNGLDSMQMRAQELAGTLEINSTPNTGTTIRVRFPI
ncbi:MAG TPA: tetratricopeptide repeat protein [Chitinophagales bacterium]|nr:tetratricopeptide repeat protein [Chitinophagales bacterium]HNI53865.1 tetratricopeptide repeat protein [Chitinophagales bacterium]HNM09007.1 tetratricopeptide repeat protein [Chitinophagales bacterium]